MSPINIIDYQSSETLLGKLSPYLRWLREGRETASSRVQGITVRSPADLRPLGGNLAAVSAECVPAAGLESVTGALLGTQLGSGWSRRRCDTLVPSAKAAARREPSCEPREEELQQRR